MRLKGIKATLGSFRGLRNNVLANIYGQGITIVSQLALIPILIHAWGTYGLGQWTILFALPSLLAYGDLGFGVVAGNTIGEAEASGNMSRALQAFRTGKLFSAAASSLAFLILATLTFIAAHNGITNGLSTQSFTLATILLAAASAVTLQYGFYISALRGLGEWSSATITNNNFRLIETVSLAAIATLSKQMEVAALGILIVRVATLVSLSAKLRSYHESSKHEKFSRPLLMTWVKPALSFSTMPISQLLLLNIPLLIIGRVSGNSAVAEFTVCRTFSRIPIQATNIIGTALAGPALREAATSGVATVTPRITKISSIAALGAFAAATVLFAIHPKIFSLWTHDAVQPDTIALALMLACAAFSAAWNIGSNYLSAINRHSKLYLFYFGLALSALMLANLLSTGIRGMAAALLFVEAAMAFYTTVNLKGLSKSASR